MISPLLVLRNTPCGRWETKSPPPSSLKRPTFNACLGVAKVSRLASEQMSKCSGQGKSCVLEAITNRSLDFEFFDKQASLWSGPPKISPKGSQSLSQRRFTQKDASTRWRKHFIRRRRLDYLVRRVIDYEHCCQIWNTFSERLLQTLNSGHTPDSLFAHSCDNSFHISVMIKASEGGGGKGIRKVENFEDFPTAFRQVQTEVPGSPIFIMKLAKNARHLEVSLVRRFWVWFSLCVLCTVYYIQPAMHTVHEWTTSVSQQVQLLADEYGNAISIFGRDCSIQRRHQKIVEEAPASIADAEVRFSYRDTISFMFSDMIVNCECFNR